MWMWLYIFLKIYECYIILNRIINRTKYLNTNRIIIYLYLFFFLWIWIRILIWILVECLNFYPYTDRFGYENKFKQILSYLLLSLYPKKTNKNLNNACIENVGGLSILPCFLQTYLKEKTPKIKMKILESSNS